MQRNTGEVRGGDEVLSIDGYTVILRFSPEPMPGVMERVRDTLLNQRIASQGDAKTCNFGANVG